MSPISCHETHPRCRLVEPPTFRLQMLTYAKKGEKSSSPTALVELALTTSSALHRTDLGKDKMAPGTT